MSSPKELIAKAKKEWVVLLNQGWTEERLRKFKPNMALAHDLAVELEKADGIREETQRAYSELSAAAEEEIKALRERISELELRIKIVRAGRTVELAGRAKP